MAHSSLRPMALLSGLTAACLISTSALAVEPGQDAPDFTLDGPAHPVHLSAYRGKTVYLDFWASWCGPCKQSMPWMNEMQKRYGAKGFQVIGVNVDQKSEDAKAFLSQVPAQFDIAFDPSGTTPKTYGIKGMPTSMLIGRDGKVRLIHQGFKSENAAELESAIQQALQH